MAFARCTRFGALEQESDLLVATDGSMSTVARQLLGEEKLQSMTRIHNVRGYGCSRWISEEEWNALAPEGTISGIIHGRMPADAPDDGFSKPALIFYSLNKIYREPIFSYARCIEQY
ncbi:hypothetical protein G6F57_022038 [Rhizopus arrhizus]|nr:hypothetical protein G6F57_022038 [Rhizopus arrhizus]